ncbi:MAG TPA: LCP family protein [Syntrophomonadaceae bacterium]|nr:LCP family protein [Syntrophomonadaceae bacterium]
MAKAKIYLRIMCAAGLLFGLFFAVGAGVGQMLHRLVFATSPAEQPKEFLIEGTRTNILLLGVDARPGQTHSRSDTMILVSLDPQLKKIAVISIPRDSRISINGNMDKINAANAYGGPELATKLVGELLSTKVDYYVEMDFSGFKNIIDTLGGVEINVPQRMYKPSEDIDLKPGQQRLDGRGSLAFVRFREYMYGDIQRTQQQQVFIKALAKEVLQPKTITRLPQLVDQVRQSVSTNLSAGDMLKLVAWASAFQSDGIVSQTLPGKFYDVYAQDGSVAESFWQVDKQAAAQVIDNLFAGRTEDVVQGGNSPPAQKTTTESTQKAPTTKKSTTPAAGVEPTKETKKDKNTPTTNQNSTNHSATTTIKP